MLKLQTMLFKVTIGLPLGAQSKNLMTFIWNFTEVVQSPVKIWATEHKRIREQEIVWTHSSFTSELKHPWVRSPLTRTVILGPTHDVLSTYKNLAFHAASRGVTGVSGGLPDTRRRHWEEEGLHFDDPFYCNKLVQAPFCLQLGANRNVR